ncbi:MAG: dTMP kinase [Acidobacteria bacterium]|nr:dTMP kinase [Acidobacteriota bacterium]
MTGLLIVFEGLDQSGKETQARLLRQWFETSGRRVESIAFPDYTSPIGQEIRTALHGGRDYAADTIQLLQIANRHQWKPQIERWMADGRVVISDRYAASSVAYGEAQGLDPAWLTSTQVYLPQPSTTVLLDIAPDVAAARKAQNRDNYERDLAMLSRVRVSYLRQAAQPGWVVIDAARPVDVVAADVTSAVWSRLAPR